MRRVLILALLLSTVAWGQPVSARNKFKVGRGDFQRGNYARAIPALQAAIKEDPSYIDAHYLLGLSYLGMENYPKAEETLTYVIGLDPSFLAAQQYLGQVLVAQKKYEEARKHFARMSKVPGGASAAAYCLGVVAYQEKNLTLAEKQWNEAIRLDPKDARSRNNLGILRSAEGKHVDAIVHFQGAARLMPENPNYVLNEGWEQLALGRPELARKAAEKARKNADQNHEVGFLAEALLAKISNRWEAVSNHADSVIRRDKENTRAWMLKAEALENLKKPAEALEAYTQALASDPNQKDAEKAIARLKAASPSPSPTPSASPGAKPSQP